jgi:hypothetical protein
MKVAFVLAMLLLMPSLAAQTTMHARANKDGDRAHVGTRPSAGSRMQGYLIEGREVAAPPWSFACINDAGPRQCDEPMWVYGSPDYIAQFTDAFPR